MTALAIDRLTATAHVRQGEPEAGRVMDRMLARIVERSLDDAIQRAELPAGDWFLRRLDVELQMDLAAPDPTSERRWAEQIVTALSQALDSGAAIHFTTRCDALVDLIGETSLSRFEHSWVWRQAGLITGDVEAQPRDAVLAALSQHAELALPALARALREAGVPAVHRLFGTRGWIVVGAIVLGAHAASPGALAALAGVAGSDPPPLADPALDAPAAQRAGVVLRSSPVAQLLRRSRLRADAATAVAWAVLAVADAEPGALSRPIAPLVITHVAAELGGTAPGGGNVARPRSGPDRRGSAGRTAPLDLLAADTDTDTDADTDTDTASRPEAQTRLPVASDADGVAAQEADDRDGAPTAWAGLLFLLATADDAGVPAEIFDDDALATRPLAWVLHAIGCVVVPAAADDPAVLALAGLLPSDEPPSLAWCIATDAERDRITEHARRWVVATAARVRTDGAEADLVRAVARRTGVVIAQRGWIDVQLSLDEVDVDVRRGGLDVDPGWVPWLGSVVRFRYV